LGVSFETPKFFVLILESQPTVNNQKSTVKSQPSTVNCQQSLLSATRIQNHSFG